MVLQNIVVEVHKLKNCTLGSMVLLKALFASLIIRTFQLIFSAGTMFFSHNKSAGTVFRLFFSEASGDKMYCITAESELPKYLAC